MEPFERLIFTQQIHTKNKIVNWINFESIKQYEKDWLEYTN